jgi:phosphoglycolate phosphatase
MDASSSINTIIFDMDGTIVDSSDGIVKSAIETLNQLDLPMLSNNQIKSIIGPPVANSIRNILNLNDNDTEIFDRMFKDIYYRDYLFNSSIYFGIPQLLQKLNGVVCLAIATHKAKIPALQLLKHFGIEQYFSIVEGAEIGIKKSKQEMINNILKSNEIQAHQAILIGDTMSDYDAAIGSNVGFIGVNYGFGLNKSDERFITFENVKDLSDYLETLLKIN